MVGKGWRTNRDSCFVDWTARGSLTFQSSVVRKSLSDLLRYLSAPAFPTSWLRISCPLSMPRPSPSPPTQTHSLARSAGNDFLLVYFDGFFNLTSAADRRTDGRTDGPSSRSPPPAQPTTTGETQHGPCRGNGCRSRQGRFSSGRAEPDRHGRGQTGGRTEHFFAKSFPSLPDE